MKTRFFFLLFISLFALPTFAQHNTALLDSYFDALGANNKFMGSVAISQNGKVIYSKSVGYAYVETAKKLNSTTKFRIGSISKMFTAAMVFKAVEEKKINLTDNIGSYFPTVPNAPKITIAQLLNHHSGIHNFTDNEDYTSWMAQPKTEAELIAIIANDASDFEPGSKGDYSNSNYILLSFILQKIYKKPYKELVNQKITQPLGLKNTYYGGKITPANNEAYSYSYEGKWDKGPETDMSVPIGAGAMLSTPIDLSLFIEALFAGKIVSAASLQQMQTIQDGYGMGMFRFPFNDKTSYGHTGGIDGFSSMLSYFPNDKVTFALTSNGSNYDNNDIAIASLGWFYTNTVTVPEFKTYTYTPEELDKFTGNYTSKDIPLGIAITKEGTTLKAQATGQSAFPLDATGKNEFTFKMAGIIMEFNPEAGQLVLKQGGGVYNFVKK